MSSAIQQLDRNMAITHAGSDLVWYDLRELTIEGKGWQDTESFYDRWPARAKGTVRDVVWQLGQRSAGIAARFVTDSTTIAARWMLRFPALAMDHMPATGVSGLDLYAADDKGWHWVGVGREPEYPQTSRTLAAELVPGRREYRLYLPLYNGVDSVQIGIEAGAAITAAAPSPHKPLCFYGTSIVQGGSASRPGMAYPAILGRRLMRPVLNLGLSGNAKAETPVADLLAELDPCAYVLDPLPNLLAHEVTQHLDPLIRTLRRARPRTPIVLVENIVYQQSRYIQARHDRCTQSNAALRHIHARLLQEGWKHIHYVSCDDLLGDSGEATVDGTHPTDAGHLALAQALGPALASAGAVDAATACAS
ncbi:MAG: SGNH/GDSL hydrolase family protein [Phycisphaeraceae bacterium]